MDPKNFFAELKRRNVYKVAVAYAVVAWLLLQGASIVLPSFEAPGWTMKVLIVALAIGLPVAAVLAWAFEITPEGIVRADEVDPQKPIARKTRRKLTAIIILIAILAAGLFIFQKSRRVPEIAPKTVAPSTVSQNEESVAVLPFDDLSAKHDQQFFGDGLAEELLNVLVQIDGLSVASRTSSFAFKGKNLSIPDIAKTLGVAHIVEGSVRRVDNRLRVTAQLIDVATDRHLWSQTFDRDVTDIFAIQDEIARSIAEALKVRLARGADKKAGTKSVEAYELYLLGLYHQNQRTEDGLRKALDTFRAATERDPSFARAFAALSMTYSLLPGYAAFDQNLANQEALLAAEKAVALDPKSAEALTALAQSYFDQGKMRQALEAYDRAVAANPRYAVARHWKGIVLTAVGRVAEGEAELRAGRALDPASLPLQSFLSMNLARQGRFEEALAEALDVLRRAPDYRNALHQAFTQSAVLGRAREFVGVLERYFRVIGEDPALGATIVDAMENPALRPKAIAALESVAPRHRTGGKKNQMASLFALLKAETQTLDLLENEEFDLYGPLPYYDFLSGNPRYEAILASQKRRLDEEQVTPAQTKP
jgi:TolB-like protein/cytochrome c-type biogenesis protein CcmH/NrfG